VSEKKNINLKTYIRDEYLYIDLETTHGWDETRIDLKALAIALRPHLDIPAAIQYRKPRGKNNG